MRGAPGSHVVDHGLDQGAPDSFAALALGDVDVPDPGDVLLEPGGDEADHLAVLLGEEEPVRMRARSNSDRFASQLVSAQGGGAGLSDCQRSQSR